MVLTNLDQAALYELARKSGIVRDRIRDVAVRRRMSMAIDGPGGTGKSRLLRDTLDDLEVSYHIMSGHTTPMGLFDALMLHQDGNIVLDDNQNLLNDRSGQEMLLAAADGGTDGVRIVRYSRRNKNETVRFSGGLYLISNRHLHDDNEVKVALKSRLRPIHWDPSDAQLIALMKSATLEGWKRKDDALTADECLEVVQFLITNCSKYGARIDLRLFFEVLLPDRAATKRGEHEADWRDHAICTLREQVGALEYSGQPKTRAEQMKMERQIAERIRAEHKARPDQIAAWVAETGKSERAFDRRSKHLRMAE